MRQVAGAALALTFGLGLAACGASGGARAALGRGAPAPDFTLADLDGREVRLSDLRGKVVLLDFWATWCVPCEAEMPHLERLYAERKGKGFEIVAVSMDGPESAATVRPTVARLGITFPVAIDADTQVVSMYNQRRAAPYAVLIDRRGSVAWVHEGYVPGDEGVLRQQVDRLLR